MLRTENTLLKKLDKKLILVHWAEASSQNESALAIVRKRDSSDWNLDTQHLIASQVPSIGFSLQ